MKKRKWLAAALTAAFFLSACSMGESAEISSVTETDKTGTDGEETETSAEIFAMDTYMTVTAYGEQSEQAVDAAVEEIGRLDEALSTGNEESEISVINANGCGTLSEDADTLVSFSLELYEETGGLFDIAIYPLMEAWGFPTGEYTVPSEEELEQLLQLCDAENILYDAEGKSIRFTEEGMAIDLGGIAKGYTSQQVMDIFSSYNITSAVINLGGNVAVLGNKTDGSLWKIGIQSPDDENGYIGILSAANVFVITSGGYERYFEEDGVTYHHILDPRTGYPADSGLVSVSIVSRDGTLADALSTSLFIMGAEEAENFWRENSDEFDMILLTEENEIYITEGIEDSFTSSELPVYVLSAE